MTLRMAPEGRPFLLIGAGLLGLLVLLRWAWPGWPTAVALGLGALLFVWLLVFFRDPVRDGPRGERLVVAPADGRICSVADVEEPMYLHAKATRVSIFMNVFDVHVNRYPVSGEIEIVHYSPGEFRNAALDEAAIVNESSSVGIRGPRGPLLVRQVAGLVARRIVTDGQPGDTARQGERMGMIRFGSRVDVFLAPGTPLKVALGDTVQAGLTVLAEYPA
jgi:phosphatidylserine decarboxylase